MRLNLECIRVPFLNDVFISLNGDGTPVVVLLHQLGQVLRLSPGHQEPLELLHQLLRPVLQRGPKVVPDQGVQDILEKQFEMF